LCIEPIYVNIAYPPSKRRLGVMTQGTATQKTIDPEKIARDTPPPTTKIGIEIVTRTLATPRPDLAGYRLQIPGQPSIYLIDENGNRRGIPNPTTYKKLFRNWSGVVADVDLNEIPDAGDLDNGAVLVKGINTPSVYIMDGGKKRGITSPAVMDKYYFNWDTIVSIPDILVNAIASGPNWA
jgi:hypothetical protein